MKFYMTKESVDYIKNSFFPIKSLYVINPAEILNEFEIIKDKKLFDFFVNEEIKNKILYAINKKRGSTIIYVNKNLDDIIIKNIKTILSNNDIIEYVFIDKKEDETVELYSYFDEIVFFPKHKKMRIIECESIKNPLFYWVNDIKLPKIK